MDSPITLCPDLQHMVDEPERAKYNDFKFLRLPQFDM